MQDNNPIQRLQMAILIAGGVVVVGVVGFMYLEHFSFLRALWLTITTVTTVGYGNDLPLTVPGKVFTMFLIVVGVGTIAYAFGTIVGVVVDGQIASLMERKSMDKSIARLKEHIIVCGAGRVGSQVVERLEKEKVPFVVVEHDEARVKELLENKCLVVQGDANEDKVLLAAGVERARGLVAPLSGDSDNVFVTLTGKELNPRLTVVARAERPETEAKLRRAGADKIIAPSVIGGRRMAISILKPITVDFVETLITDHSNLEIEIEEVPVSEDSCLRGVTLRDSGIKLKTGAMVVAVQREQRTISNPDADQQLLAGDVLIVIGTREQLKALEAMAQEAVVQESVVQKAIPQKV